MSGMAIPTTVPIAVVNSVHKADRSIRHGFARKVFALLTLKLLITVSIVFIFTHVKIVNNVIHKVYPWLLPTLGIICICTQLILSCTSISRRHPINIITLFLFTVIFGCLLGVATSVYPVQAIARSAGFTMCATFGLFVYSCQTKVDVTSKALYLYIGVFIFVTTSLMALILPDDPITLNLYSAAGAIILSSFVVYDTQLILGGHHGRYQFTVDEYITASLYIYLDITCLFLVCANPKIQKAEIPGGVDLSDIV